MEKELKDALTAVYEQLENQEKSLAQLRLFLCALRETMKEVSPQLEAAYGRHYAGSKCEQVRRANDLALRMLAATRQSIEGERADS
jgi:phage shock protein A